MPMEAVAKENWKPAIQIALVFAAVKVAIDVIGNLVAQHFGYGIFRDEMYYLICGRHLAWGYVDQGPIVALQARISEVLFGIHNLALLRLFSGLAGAAKVFMTGLLVLMLGGKRMTQMLAMTAVLMAPIYLAIDSFLSMNSFEPVFWMGCLLAVLWIVRGGSPRWWMAFGISAGVGILNKPDIAFFLVAMLVALLLTPQRKILGSSWMLAGVGLMFLIVLPYLLWQIHHQWPTLVWLNNVNHSDKNVKLGTFTFLLEQIRMLSPISILLLLPGMVWLLAAKSARGFRWIGILYVVLLAIMLHFQAKIYYVAPVYPMLLAAGALAWQHMFSSSRKTAWLLPAWCVVIAILGAITLPMAIPVLPPYTFIRYTRALHLTDIKTETGNTGPLPQLYADRFGWHGLVAEVARIYHSLSAADQAKVGIFCDNYGEASAINLFGSRYDLPTAVSGHQNYFYWGPHGYTGQLMIVVGERKKGLERYCSSVQQVGATDNPLAPPTENRPIYLCRGGKVPLAEHWPQVKNWH